MFLGGSVGLDLDPKILWLVENIRDQLILGRSLLEIEKRLRPIASDLEIESALKVVKAESSEKRSRQTSTLTDKLEPEDWYQGPSHDPESHWSKLGVVLRGKRSRPWSDAMVESLDISSSNVVSHLAPPKSQVPRKVKGLVLGYVQSGKTANFSAVIAKAVDAGYRQVIVLAGMHNILRLQTQARLDEEIVKPKEGSCITLTRVDEKGDFQKRQAVSANQALGGTDRFTLVVLKKNTSVLRSFNAWLDEGNSDTISNCTTLIIDDESDQASVNTNKPEDDPTAINNHIRTLVNKFNVVSYVGYTATPFANVLIDSSVTDDLYPKDFIITLDKPLGYVGPEELFGRDAIEPKGALVGLPVLRTVPDAEAAVYAAKTFNLEGVEALVPSAREALYSFVVACSMRLCRNQWKQHMTMLFHISHLVDRHKIMMKALDITISQMKIDRESENENLKAALMKIWQLDFVPTSKAFKNEDGISFDLIWENCEKFLERLQLVMENHESEERLTYAGAEPFWGVVVGGNTLSRGLTLEGLTTSYFVRGSKGYDTLLQMGRWFGYRPNYVDLTRIYVSEDLESRFYHLATVEQEIRDEIKTMAANKEKPVDVALKIRTHPSMTVTSNLKMRSAEVCSLTYSGSKIQALYMNLRDPKILSHNLSTTGKFLLDIEKFGGKSESPIFEDYSAAQLFRNVSPELVLQFIEAYRFSSANIRFTPKMISNYIQDLTKLGELTDWSVAVMSPKSGVPLKLGNILVNKVDRSIVRAATSENDPQASHIKVLTTPRDELVDLFDLIGSPVIRFTDDLFKNREDSLSEVLIRQKVRPKERGLLLLYALNPKPNISEDEHNQIISSSSVTVPLVAAGDAIGVAFVFPKTDNSKSLYRYVVNGTV